jgi:hypothetical protein
MKAGQGADLHDQNTTQRHKQAIADNTSATKHDQLQMQPATKWLINRAVIPAAATSPPEPAAWRNHSLLHASQPLPATCDSGCETSWLRVQDGHRCKL